MFIESFRQFLVTGVVALAVRAPMQAEDWPQYRGPNADGTTPETVQLTKWTAEGPREVWKVPTPTGFSSISVSGERAFTLIGEEDNDGVQREVCLALDAATGKELWRKMLGISKYDGGGDSGADGAKGGDGPRSTPTLDGNRVYVYDARMHLYCFEAGTGNEIWMKDIEKDFEGRNIRWQSAMSPLLEGDNLYIAGGGPDQSFIAFNKTTGDMVWKSQDELMTHATPIPATIHGVRQIIFFAQSGLVSVNAETGERLWDFEHPYEISTAASPVVDGDLVYMSAGYGIGAALCRIEKSGDGFEATRVWRKKNEMFNHWSTPVLKDGHLYGMFSFKKYGQGPIECVELESGEVKWSQSGFGPGNCILAGDQLIALSDAGHLVLIDATPEAYKEVARAKVVDGKCWSTPTFSNGRIYARSVKEGVCVDVSTVDSR